MITVKPYKNENIDSLLLRFKRECKNDRLFLRIAEKEFFVKPSLKRRNKRRRKMIDSDL